MSLMELFNLLLIVALVVFSIWCFIRRLRGNCVCTVKDLLLAFVTGGSLAVVTLVSGVTGDILNMSNSIKADTETIRTVVTGEKVSVPDVPGQSPFPAGDLARLNDLASQNTRDLQNLSRSVNAIQGLLEELSPGRTIPSQTPQETPFPYDDFARLSAMVSQNGETLRALSGSIGNLQDGLNKTNQGVAFVNRGIEMLLAQQKPGS